MREPASTSSIGRPPETNRPISSSGRCVAESPMRWNGCVGGALEALERQRQMGAALRAGDGVHLVDDHGLDPAQHLPALRGEEEIERLGGGDQDVGRRAQHLAALALVGVARPHADRQRRAEPGERAAEVALDVVVERLQRRDVEQAQPLAGARVEAVDPGQERRQRLARAGRCLHEHVRAARDHGPGGKLRRRRAGKRALEPGARCGAEACECVHPPRVSRRVAAWPVAGAGYGHLGSPAWPTTTPIHFSGDPEADAFLGESPLALMIGFVLDQQVTVQKAFSSPLVLAQRLGGLDATRSRRWIRHGSRTSFREKPALHRFPANMARRTQEFCAAIASEYDGDAAAVWTGARDGADLEQRLLALPGIGEMKARTIIGVIAKRLGVRPQGWEEFAPLHESLGDVDSPQALAEYQAAKRARKAAYRAAQQQTA